MKELPILLSGPMVRASIDGHKTQTRRAVKWPRWITKDNGEKRCAEIINSNEFRAVVKRGTCDGIIGKFGSPYGVPGDRLWVRETWTPHEESSGDPWEPYKAGILYRADGSFVEIKNTNEAVEDWLKVWDGSREHKWRPSIYMPRWASRITLEVTGIRIERVHDISERDSRAEGIFETPRDPGFESWSTHGMRDYYATPRRAFKYLWDSINEKRGYGWNSNPFVWVIEFRVI
jgi:hypothetical protein